MAFDIPIDKDVDRRILASHYRPAKNSCGPSWLTFIGHLKDSLWSIDLDIVNLRCEGRTCARSARVGQPTVTASQVAKERALTSRW